AVARIRGDGSLARRRVQHSGHEHGLVLRARDRDGVRPLFAVRSESREILAHHLRRRPMSTTLAAAAMLMGLAGGPHCVAMCGPACAGLVRMGSRPAQRSLWLFHAGRVVGYSM